MPPPTSNEGSLEANEDPGQPNENIPDPNAEPQQILNQFIFCGIAIIPSGLV